MTTLSTEYRVRKADAAAADAAFEAYVAENDWYETPELDAIRRARDLAFSDFEDLRVALRPGTHRDAYKYVNVAGGSTLRSDADRFAVRLRELLLDGVKTLPRRPKNYWVLDFETLRPSKIWTADLSDYSPLWARD